jgi:hypothetical protein
LRLGCLPLGGDGVLDVAGSAVVGDVVVAEAAPDGVPEGEAGLAAVELGEVAGEGLAPVVDSLAVAVEEELSGIVVPDPMAWIVAPVEAAAAAAAAAAEDVDAGMTQAVGQAVLLAAKKVPPADAAEVVGMVEGVAEEEEVVDTGMVAEVGAVDGAGAVGHHTHHLRPHTASDLAPGLCKVVVEEVHVAQQAQCPKVH